MVVHLLTDTGDGEVDAPQVGLVVSKAVGNAVRRNTVKRRMRAAVAGMLTELPAGTRLVLRALPPAASASYQEIDADLGSCVHRALRRSTRGTTAGERPLSGAGSPARKPRRTTTPPGSPTNGGTAA